jgi:hypothetical protein
VRIWQNHVLSDGRPDWCPEGEFSPNTLYEYGLAQTGIPLRAMTSNDYYALLPAVHVKVHSRGVHLHGLYYDGEALNGVRNEPSRYGGRVKGKWTVKHDPRDLRRVFFLDADGVYQPLTWVGATRDTPCFNDRNAAALTALRRERGVAPHHQDALAEILLTEVLAVQEPIAEWSTLSAKARKEISRRKRQERMVERDQAASGVPKFADSYVEEHDEGKETTPGVAAEPEQRPSPLTALDTARARKNAAQVAPTQQETVASAPRLGSGSGSGKKSIFGFDADAYRTAREMASASPQTDDPSLTVKGDEEA